MVGQEAAKNFFSFFDVFRKISKHCLNIRYLLRLKRTLSYKNLAVFPFGNIYFFFISAGLDTWSQGD